MRSIVALVILLGITGLFFLFKKPEPATNLNIVKSECHFENGVCQVELAEFQPLRFELSPADLPAMEPLFLKITWLANPKTSFSHFKVWFEGRDMNMGQHFMLPEQDQHSKTLPSPEILTFKGMIPVCSVDERMVWRLIIEYSEAENRQQIHFDIL